MALDTNQRLEDFTVAELRQMARQRGIKRYSKMKKAELVRAVQRAEQDERPSTRDEPATRPSAESSWSAEPTWSGEAAATGAETEGEQYVTSDHDEIRAWADARNAVPATEQATGEGTEPTALCFRFPQTLSQNLRLIDWPTWFRAFDTLRLRLIYLRSGDGSPTNDYQLQRR